MNRQNQLEKHLLSRYYNDPEQLEELLETRYTFSGATKPSLVLLPTGSDQNTTTKSLLNEQSAPTPNKQLQRRNASTRVQVKEFFKRTKISQRNVKNAMKNSGKTPKDWPQMAQKYNIPTVEEFLPMNEAWQRYMRQLIIPGVEEPTEKLPSRQMVLSKLASADYHGCLLTVINSRNTHLIGMKGIVVYDNQYTFAICVPNDPTKATKIGGIRFIPKKHTLFGFDVKLWEVDGKEEIIPFTLIGSRFEYRSVDRSTKKFKNHNVDDIV